MKPRKDGVKARCGGPSFCSDCSDELKSPCDDDSENAYVLCSDTAYVPGKEGRCGDCGDKIVISYSTIQALDRIKKPEKNRIYICVNCLIIRKEKVGNEFKMQDLTPEQKKDLKIHGLPIPSIEEVKKLLENEEFKIFMRDQFKK